MGVRMLDKYVSVSEAIKMTGYSRWWLVKLCRDEKLDCRKWNFMWAIHRDSLKDYCERVERAVRELD